MRATRAGRGLRGGRGARGSRGGLLARRRASAGDDDVRAATSATSGLPPGPKSKVTDPRALARSALASVSLTSCHASGIGTRTGQLWTRTGGLSLAIHSSARARRDGGGWKRGSTTPSASAIAPRYPRIAGKSDGKMPSYTRHTPETVAGVFTTLRITSARYHVASGM